MLGPRRERLEPAEGALRPGDLGAVGQVQVVFVLGVVELVFGPGQADLATAVDFVGVDRAGVGNCQQSHLAGHAEGDVGGPIWPHLAHLLAPWATWATWAMWATMGHGQMGTMGHGQMGHDGPIERGDGGMKG
jgi:hypothetical protein